MDGVTFYFEWEVNLIQWLQSMMGGVATTLAKIITLFGEEAMLVLIICFLYFCFDKELAKYIGENITVGMIANPMIKNIFNRRRPYFDNEGIKCLKKVKASADQFDIAAQGFSFPSGHSTHSSVVYGSFPIYINGILRQDEKIMEDFDISSPKIKRKIQAFRITMVIAFLMPLLVGCSRFALGVHYPTDVIVGWLLGVVVLIAMSLLRKLVKSRHRRNLGMFIISALGITYCRSDDYFSGLGVMAGVYLAIYFEEKYVNFEIPNYKTLKGAGKCVLRLIGAGVVYYGLNMLIKLPVSEAFRTSATMGAFMFRFVRYTVTCFATLGLYPMLFKLFDKERIEA